MAARTAGRRRRVVTADLRSVPPVEAAPVLVSVRAIQLDLEAADPAAAIRAVGAPLVAAGWVAPEYLEAAVRREAIYPTGLPTTPEAVAVPHADPDWVARPAIAIGRLRRPVRFLEMATTDHELSVRIVLLLALRSKDEAAVLGTLVRGFQSGDLLAFLGTTDSPAAVAERVATLLGVEPAP